MKSVRRKTILAVVVSIIFLAYVSPIPEARISEQLDMANDIRMQKFQLNTGEFSYSESFTFNGTDFTLSIVGEVIENSDSNVAQYSVVATSQDKAGRITLILDNNFTQELPSDICFIDDRPLRNNILALDDYGTFQYYYWYTAKMVKVPGSTIQEVKYDHPDNYYYRYYHPQEWNLNWKRAMQTNYGMIHLSQSEISNAIMQAGIVNVALVIADAAIGLYFLSISSMTLALWIIAGIMAFLAVFSIALTVWLEYVLKAEQGDGWAYTYWNGAYLQASYGGWKDYWIISW